MQSYIEISKTNLLNNFYAFKNYLGKKTKIMCVLKSNAYGRGLKEVVQILHNHAEYFVVDDVVELKELRHFTDTPTLLLGSLSVKDLRTALKLNGDISIYDINQLRRINMVSGRTGKKPRLHIELDAQFGRTGILLEDLSTLLDEARKMKNVEIYGIYAHLSCATDRKNNSHDKRQISFYKKAIDLCYSKGFRSIKTHIVSTAGTAVYSNKEYDFVRLGAGLYGVWPSDDIKKIAPIKNLKPILRWISYIGQIKSLPANYPVGYGKTYTTSKPTKIAIIPQGYGDGYDCKLSNKGHLLVKGRRCKILGRISMNMMVINVSQIDDIQEGDEVVLIGHQGNEEITIEEYALNIDTMHAEATTKINALLPRKII